MGLLNGCNPHELDVRLGHRPQAPYEEPDFVMLCFSLFIFSARWQLNGSAFALIPLPSDYVEIRGAWARRRHT